MTTPPANAALQGIDEILEDVAEAIEPTPSDIRIMNNRYRALDTYLHRDGSKIAPYLITDASLIYAQGSVSISTLVISGIVDDRFDVDAMVEIDAPEHWDNDTALDVLFESLEGFPGAVKITRCTRCVQIEFATMHMDVTVIDRRARLRPDRAGEIFHSPDEGASSRVPANPWGFTKWFRDNTRLDLQYVQKSAARWARNTAGRTPPIDAVERVLITASAEQVDLPPMIPARLDAIEVVALKLLKRFLTNHYETLDVKRPPSIWVTKLARDLGASSDSLAVQLGALAMFIKGKVELAIRTGTGPDDRNPSYYADRLNDRWPRTGTARKADLEACVNAMNTLRRGLDELSTAPLDRARQILDELFGIRIGAAVAKALVERYRRTSTDAPARIELGTGKVFAPSLAPSRPSVVAIPQHKFHSGVAPNAKGPRQ